MAKPSISTPKESRAVQLWRSELKDDVTRLSSAIEGLSARASALDHNKAGIDRATHAELQALEIRLNDVLGDARYEHVEYEDGAAPAERGTPEAPYDNPVRAFLLATKWLEGSCYCNDDDAQHGHELVAAVAVEIRKQDDEPTMPLTIKQCSNVLDFVTMRKARESGHVEWLGGSPDHPHSEAYGGDPGYGLFLIVRHVINQLRKGGAA